jgi:hypothetical protein
VHEQHAAEVRVQNVEERSLLLVQARSLLALARRQATAVLFSILPKFAV